MRSTHLLSELAGIAEKVRHGEKAHSLDLYPVSSGGTASVDGMEDTLLWTFLYYLWVNILYTVSESLSAKRTQ